MGVIIKNRIFLAELLSFVERVCQSEPLRLSGSGETLEDFLQGFPTVSREAAVAALEEANTCFSRVPKCTLIDECIDERFRNSLTVTIAKQPATPDGRLKNGDLLKAAEANKFDVFLTVDQGIEYQQNLTGRKIAIIVSARSRTVCIISCNLCPLALHGSNPFVPDRS